MSQRTLKWIGNFRSSFNIRIAPKVSKSEYQFASQTSKHIAQCASKKEEIDTIIFAHQQWSYFWLFRFFLSFLFDFLIQKSVHIIKEFVDKSFNLCSDIKMIRVQKQNNKNTKDRKIKI